jgi:hypothetical protein
MNRDYLVYEIDTDIDGYEQIEAQVKKLFPLVKAISVVEGMGKLVLTYRYRNELYEYLNQLDEGELEIK